MHNISVKIYVYMLCFSFQSKLYPETLPPVIWRGKPVLDEMGFCWMCKKLGAKRSPENTLKIISCRLCYENGLNTCFLFIHITHLNCGIIKGKMSQKITSICDVQVPRHTPYGSWIMQWIETQRLTGLNLCWVTFWQFALLYGCILAHVYYVW